jgi:hypothetical protein
MVRGQWGGRSDSEDPRCRPALSLGGSGQWLTFSDSYEQRKGIHFPHAFANTQLFFDYDNAGAKFPDQMVPIAVNYYGEHRIARRGGWAKFAEINAGESLDPPGPSPKRCFEVGQAIGRAVAAKLTSKAVVAAGQHEMLNWFCLLGAMSELGMT